MSFLLITPAVLHNGLIYIPCSVAILKAVRRKNMLKKAILLLIVSAIACTVCFAAEEAEVQDTVEDVIESSITTEDSAEDAALILPLPEEETAA